MIFTLRFFVAYFNRLWGKAKWHVMSRGRRGSFNGLTEQVTDLDYVMRHIKHNFIGFYILPTGRERFAFPASNGQQLELCSW